MDLYRWQASALTEECRQAALDDFCTSLFSSNLVKKWEALAERVNALPFQYPQWVAAWWRAFGSGELVIRPWWEGGRLKAVVPLERNRGCLRTAVNYHTPQFGLLAENDTVAKALLRTVFSWRPPVLHLEALAPESNDIELCRTVARMESYQVMTRPHERACYLPLDNSFASYQDGLRNSLRKELRRCGRRLDETGERQFSVSHGEGCLPALLEKVFSLECSGWKDKRGTAIRSSSETHAFYSDIATWAAGRDMLRIFFLSVGGRPLAVDFAIEQRGVLHLLKGGFDREWRRFSPGNLLMQEIIRYGFDRNLSRIEFHGDAEDYKLRWSRSVRTLLKFTAFAPSLKGRVAWMQAGLLMRLRALHKAHVKKSQNKGKR